MKKISLLLILFIFTITAYSQQLNVTSHSLIDTSAEKKYEVRAYYPQFDFGKDALMGVNGIATDINTEIIRVIYGQINPFKEQSAADNLDCPQERNNLEINYSMIYKDNGYISIVFESFLDTRCAAHPMTYRTTFNYNYLNKGLLAVDSLFLPGSAWLTFISDYCIKDLMKRAKKEGLENNDPNIIKGASPVSDNFRTFTVNEYTLDIIFNLYQVGPYVWGFQTVSIPWDKLKDKIDPQGPVGFILNK